MTWGCAIVHHFSVLQSVKMSQTTFKGNYNFLENIIKSFARIFLLPSDELSLTRGTKISYGENRQSHTPP